MPRSTFSLKVSLWYAAINPKRGSSGACGTLSEVKTVGLLPPMWPLMLASLWVGLVTSEELGGDGDVGEDILNWRDLGVAPIDKC